MSLASDETVELFTQKAEAVSAFVTRVKDLREAFEHTIDLCSRKEACQVLPAGCMEPLSPPARELCEVHPGKTIAAPGLIPEEFGQLEALGREQGILLIRDGLRGHLSGIDIGFTVVDYGLAETGTLILDSSSEEVRLATMISEFHTAVLPRSRIVKGSEEIADQLADLMKGPANYTAFITGASRTADIERVLALGVHGPLELHILIAEDL